MHYCAEESVDTLHGAIKSKLRSAIQALEVFHQKVLLSLKIRRSRISVPSHVVLHFFEQRWSPCPVRAYGEQSTPHTAHGFSGGFVIFSCLI